MRFWQGHCANRRPRFSERQRCRAKSPPPPGPGVDAARRAGLLADLAAAPSVTPASMVRIGKVDERFRKSYNVEMVEVTGGRFWEPTARTVERRLGNLSPIVRRSIPRFAPSTKARRCIGADLCTRQRDLWQTQPTLRFRHRALGAAFRIRRRSDPPAMAGRGRFLACGRAPIVTSFASARAAEIWRALDSQAAHPFAHNSSIGGRIVAAEL